MARALGELFAPSCKKPGLKEEAWAKCPVAVLGEGTEEDATGKNLPEADDGALIGCASRSCNPGWRTVLEC